MVEKTRQYSAAEMERMMKVQDVLLKAMAKKLTWWAAAEIVGVSDRTMRRWRERLEEHGYSGLADRRKGRPSDKRVPVATVEEVLRLYREVYWDLNIRHFHEKLREERSIELSYTWVQKALQGAGLVAKRRKRGPHRRRRPRRPMPGMLLHIDGSKHRWFNDGRWHDLIVILDDATSEIYYAQLVEEESTRTVMAALREVIATKGLFCALYSDRGSHFFVTPKKTGEKVDKHRLTQVGRAMKELGVQMIPAYSPQARGRSERNFGTWQGRLPQELRLGGISSVEQANQFLRERYIDEFNGKFKVAAEKGTAFRRTSRSDLDWIFTIQTERVVAKDNTVAIAERSWQLDKTRFRHTLAGMTVTIHEHMDGKVSVRWGPHVVGRFGVDGQCLVETGVSKKRRGKGGSVEAGENQKQVSSGSHRPLEISQTTRDSHFPTAPAAVCVRKPKTTAAHAA